jgi:hypothetical protein
MTKHLLAGLAAAMLMTGVATAQTYLPAPPPPPAPPPMVVVPPAPTLIPPTTSTTTTLAPAPVPGQSTTTTTTNGVDEYGNPIRQKDIYQQGVAGSSETHSTTTTDPWSGGTTTHSTTTNNPQ